MTDGPAVTILDEAVVGAGVDPRRLQAMLLAGRPEQTIELARAFEEAGQLAREAHRRARRAHAAFADGLVTDGAPALDARTEDDLAWRALGQGGQDMDDTATFLKRSVTALDTARDAAAAAMNVMTAELDRIAAAADRATGTGAGPAERDHYLAAAVAAVSTAATAVERAVDEYDRGLLRSAAELAARGYTPEPATLAGFLSPEQRAALGEFLGDFGTQFGAELADTAGGVWDLLPVRAIWEPQDYADDLARYAAGAVDTAEALVDDPGGTLLAAGHDLIGYDHWANGEPGKAVGHIAAELLLGGAAGKVLKILRQAELGGGIPARELGPAERQQHDARLDDLERRHPDDFERLWPDPDRNGRDDPASRDEARVALDLRERGLLPADIQRPLEAGQGDFYSPSTGQHYDLKGVHSDWPPLSTQRDKSMPFPERYDPANNTKFVREVQRQIDDGRTAVIDTRNADQAAISDLEQMIKDRGWGDDVIWYP